MPGRESALCAVRKLNRKQKIVVTQIEIGVLTQKKRDLQESVKGAGRTPLLRQRCSVWHAAGVFVLCEKEAVSSTLVHEAVLVSESVEADSSSTDA